MFLPGLAEPTCATGDATGWAVHRACVGCCLAGIPWAVKPVLAMFLTCSDAAPIPRGGAGIRAHHAPSHTPPPSAAMAETGSQARPTAPRDVLGFTAERWIGTPVQRLKASPARASPVAAELPGAPRAANWLAATPVPGRRCEPDDCNASSFQRHRVAAGVPAAERQPPAPFQMLRPGVHAQAASVLPPPSTIHLFVLCLPACLYDSPPMASVCMSTSQSGSCCRFRLVLQCRDGWRRRDPRLCLGRKSDAWGPACARVAGRGSAAAAVHCRPGLQRPSVSIAGV
jgi:hypothetical protein